MIDFVRFWMAGRYFCEWKMALIDFDRCLRFFSRDTIFIEMPVLTILQSSQKKTFCVVSCGCFWWVVVVVGFGELWWWEVLVCCGVRRFWWSVRYFSTSGINSALLFHFPTNYLTSDFARWRHLVLKATGASSGLNKHIVFRG